MPEFSQDLSVAVGKDVDILDPKVKNCCHGSVYGRLALIVLGLQL